MIKFCDKCYELAYTRVYYTGLPNAKICYSKNCCWSKKKRITVHPRVLYRPKSIKQPEYKI